jgi:hypothetical protein
MAGGSLNGSDGKSAKGLFGSQGTKRTLRGFIAVALILVLSVCAAHSCGWLAIESTLLLTLLVVASVIGPYVHSRIRTPKLPDYWDPSGRVRLVLFDDSAIDDPGRKALSEALRGNAQQDGWFAVLSVGKLTFMQAARARDSSEGYNLYYQDGSTKRHFEARGVLTIQEVVAAFQAYAEGSDTWKTAYRWEKFDLSDVSYIS